MNYYERFMGDYGKKTARLTMIEHGAYTLLLDEYYSTEAPLPEPYAELYRIARAMSKEEQAAVRKIADLHFPVANDGLRHNARADEEIPKARKRIEGARVNGSKGGRPKKPDENPAGNPAGLRNETQRVSGSKPSGEPTGKAPHTPYTTPTTERGSGGVTFTRPPLPKTLTEQTWASWKSHLANRGKAMTPQAEAVQLNRLKDHADPERVVQDCLANGWLNLPPIGGHDSQKPRQPSKSERSAGAMATIMQPLTGAEDAQRPDEPRDITGESRRIA
jgi:uncharacterized protein YdaU (DUF1376 family)